MKFCCYRYISVRAYNTHADDSRGSKAFSGVCVYDSVRLSVCPHGKTKTADKLQSPNLAQGYSSRVLAHQRQKVKVTGSQS